MEKNHDLKPVVTSDEAENDPLDEEVQKLLPTLEQETYWDGKTIYKYKGFWYRLYWLKPILRIERYFKTRDTDILLSSMPKSGTTWLKSLTYSIANRNVHAPSDQTTHPLFTSNPHDLIPTLELSLYMQRQNPNIEEIPSPRIFSTHLSYDALPNIVHESACKIIYICRNPMDSFVSERHFLFENGLSNRDAKALFMDESLEDYGEVVLFGPSWENILVYWKAHLTNPDKVLFLKYEELKKDDEYHIKKIAEFIGFPFSPEEVESGSVEKISKLCSFDSLSEANKKEGMITQMQVKRSSFFRKGEIGDWTNYLSKEMAQRMKDVMERKLKGSGLALDFSGI